MDLSSAFSIRGQASGGGSCASGVHLLWEQRAAPSFEYFGNLARLVLALAGQWPFPR